MSLDTPIRTSFKSQSTAYGFWLTPAADIARLLSLPSAGAARSILRSTSKTPGGGFSWVLVDGEHGLIAEQNFYELATAIGHEGASPIVRVPWNEEWMIKRALDSGAHGILTPMCHSAEDARRIVKYSKYPPLGSRGYGPSYASHSIPGVQSGDQYDNNADDQLMVLVQIESRSGVENVEEIANVNGLDGLLIGPFDLAKQLGVVRGGEEHEAAIQRTLKAAKTAGKKAAIFCTDGAQARLRAEQGFDMVSIIPDQSALIEAMQRELDFAKGVEGAGERRPGKGY